MEGLLDAALRDILTRVGGIDVCVSEFIRITDTLLPKRAFIRVIPELLNGSRTPAGVPVIGQLLGSDPICLAENAARLAELRPAGVDLNFGCPAKVVNRHGGGASLLTDPALIERIVSAVRRAVPPAIPVSAKMRLGFDDDSLAEACALAIAGGGASRIVVHARTKSHGYRPPAYWNRIADIRERVAIPIVANGEVWTVDDALRCRQIAGCKDLMVGRGMVADPGLAWAIHAATNPLYCGTRTVSWHTIRALINEFWQLVAKRVEPRHRAGRLKQWLNFLRRRYPQAEHMYAALRTSNDSRQIDDWLLCGGLDRDESAALGLLGRPVLAGGV